MWIDDQILSQHEQPFSLKVWRPSQLLVVVGNGNQAERECHLSRCLEDGVPVLKRYGGGGAVVLHSGCIIVSLGVWVSQLFESQRYFDCINQALIDCLSKKIENCKNLSLNGISDIAWNSYKMAGTSIFRSRNYLLYQASFLVDAKAKLIDRYLKHPSREPDYRKGKPHVDFVRGLDQFVDVDPAAIEDIFVSDLGDFIKQNLQIDLISPVPSQFLNLRRRVERNQACSSVENSEINFEELRLD